MSTRKINSWQELELQDLFFAFRKAKSDCFFERSICVAKRFSDYEAELPLQLQSLLSRLRAGDATSVLMENLGAPRLVAKKLGISPKARKDDGASDGHGFFSDPKRAFERLCYTHTLTPEFRVIGDFTVVMHVMSALWINLVGHKYDAALSKSAYGSRLRRYRRDPSAPESSLGEYHIESIGSFQPYFEPYKRWRKQGLNAIRSELQDGHSVIAVSMDLTSYYHRVDPSFIANSSFLELMKIDLSPWELEFTSAFEGALSAWSEKVVEKLSGMGCPVDPNPVGGLPIGLSAARVLANALLISLDRDIEQGLTPIYYGRYVDDLFLVLRDPGNILTISALRDFIQDRTPCFRQQGQASLSGNEIYLNLSGSFQGKTVLMLQPAKQKVFFLQGQGGVDLLDNIETQIRSVSSERRLMPSPDRLESMASAKVLTAAGHPSEDADTLRRADGLAVRRLGWSIQLRAVEILARDLRENDWKDERKRFYQFSHSHILRADKILDHLDYLPRLLSLAVSLQDWSEAHKMLASTLRALETLASSSEAQQIKVNGCPETLGSRPIWDELRETVLEMASDTIIRSLRWSQRKGAMRPLNDAAIALCKAVRLGTDRNTIEIQCRLLRETDWARVSYRDHLRRDAARQRPAAADESVLYGLYYHELDLRAFLESSTDSGRGLSAARVNSRCINVSSDSENSLLPYLFPTRPYTAQEIALFLPGKCVFDGDEAADRAWARYARAVRGVWVKPSLTSGAPPATMNEGLKEPRKKGLTARLGMGAGTKIRLGISSLLTTDESFSATASGRPDISRARYARIECLINQAISATPRPTHLLLPEVSLPSRWLDTVSGLLRDANISLIAGLEYHHGASSTVHSEAVLVLADDRLGFPASVQIRQVKSLPAAGEEETLLKTFGRRWSSNSDEDEKPVYAHGGFCFGVLVCSELQNVRHRLRFQGEVDCVMVLSWNQDLETFSALVESASLDVHAYIALVNNRKYGDSRVRSPAKEHHARDLCRLRGGQNEHVVVVELDIAALRAFQSRATRWPSRGDPFKPVPEGFARAAARSKTPK